MVILHQIRKKAYNLFVVVLWRSILSVPQNKTVPLTVCFELFSLIKCYDKSLSLKTEKYSIILHLFLSLHMKSQRFSHTSLGNQAPWNENEWFAVQCSTQNCKLTIVKITPQVRTLGKENILSWHGRAWKVSEKKLKLGGGWPSRPRIS